MITKNLFRLSTCVALMFGLSGWAFGANGPCKTSSSAVFVNQTNGDAQFSCANLTDGDGIPLTPLTNTDTTNKGWKVATKPDTLSVPAVKVLFASTEDTGKGGRCDYFYDEPFASDFGTLGGGLGVDETFTTITLCGTTNEDPLPETEVVFDCDADLTITSTGDLNPDADWLVSYAPAKVVNGSETPEVVTFCNTRPGVQKFVFTNRPPPLNPRYDEANCSAILDETDPTGLLGGVEQYPLDICAPNEWSNAPTGKYYEWFMFAEGCDSNLSQPWCKDAEGNPIREPDTFKRTVVVESIATTLKHARGSYTTGGCVRSYCYGGYVR